MSYAFGKTSRERLEGVHPLLIECAERALAYGILDFTVLHLGGVRTLEDQKGLVAKGASQTLNSLHRIQDTGYGHAIDIAPYPVDWKDLSRFYLMGALMFRAAGEMGGHDVIPLEWGGLWPRFKDYPHFQLKRGFV